MDVEPDNGLTPAEAERLYILMEECAEVTKECAKILRFGYAPAVGYKNREALATEIGDVLAAIDMVEMAKDVDCHDVTIAKAAKREKLKRYTKHQ